MQEYIGRKGGPYPEPEGQIPTIGTVTSVSVNTVNGFSGTVNDPTTDAAINIQTTVTGILKGNGTAVSAASASDIISSNVLTLTGTLLKSTIDGIDSNSVDFSPILPPATTNDLLNNGDNTITSTVNGVDSTTPIITAAGISKSTNAFSISINGFPAGPSVVVDTVDLSSSVNTMTVAVNGVTDTASIVNTAVPSKPDSNHITIAVNGVGTTQVTVIETVTNSTTSNQMSVAVNGVTGTSAQIVTLVDNTKPDSNHVITSVNSVPATSIPIVETNSLSLSGTSLTNTTNGVASNAVNVQPLITSPTANDLVYTNGSGQVIDSGISVSTSSVSNDNTHVMTSAATQTALTNGLAPKAPLASPALTGNPTAPTQSPGDNSTKLATTAYVDNAVSTTGVLTYNGRAGNVIPLTGDYTVSQITGAAPSNSPTFTGTPTAPTQLQGDNSTKIATTAYVDTGLNAKLSNVLNSGKILVGNISNVATAQTMSGDVNLTNAGIASLQNIPTGVATTFTSGVIKSNGSNLTSTATGNLTDATSPSIISVSGGTNATLGNVSLTVAKSNTSTSGYLSSTDWNTFNNKVASVAAEFQKSFTNVGLTASTDILVAVAPLLNSIGYYVLSITDGTANTLTVLFSIEYNNYNFTLQSKFLVYSVNDSNGVINRNNLGSYLTFISHLRTTNPNPYVAVTVRMSGGLLFNNTSTLTFTVTPFSQSFLADNTAITQYIAQPLSNIGTPDNSLIVSGTTISLGTYPASCLYAFCAGDGSNTMKLYTLNTFTGVLTPGSPHSSINVGSHPKDIKATPNGKFVYVANFSDSNITIVLINALTGQDISQSNFASGTTGYMAISPSGKFLYALKSGNVVGFTINQSTGALTLINSYSAGTTPTAIAFHPTGNYLYIADSNANVIYQYSVNSTTGVLTALSPATVSVTGGSGTLASMVIHPNGNFGYVTSSGNASLILFTISSTGTITISTSNGTGTTPKGVTISPNGLFIYVCNSGSNTLGYYTINTTTGALTVGSPATIATGTVPTGVTCDASGKFIYVTNGTGTTISMYSIDQTLGFLTALSPSTVAAGNNPAQITIF